MTNFGVFERRRPGGRARPGMTVTVTRRGYMAFSAGAWAALGSPRAVKFLTDAGGRNRAVGFRACEPGEPDANLVNPGSRVVTAMAVLRHLGHDLDSPVRRYPLHAEDGLAPYIDLDDLSGDAPGGPQEAAGEILPVSLDLAVLARHGALAGVAGIIAERRRQVEQQDEAPGKPSLPYAAEAELNFGNYARAAALIAAEIDRTARKEEPGCLT